ncbi:MAG TPA: transposase [Roseiflexaceae bacterium]|nr:transposase [Roseiflexaceae bacterium]
MADLRPHRQRSLRLRGYDYAQVGAYFITVCVERRLLLLGALSGGGVQLSPAGRMVGELWEALPLHYPAALDAFVAMPDHIHGILLLPGGGLALPQLVHRLKSLTTARYRVGVAREGWPPFPGRLWQRSYYERVIRSEDELAQVRMYIAENPTRGRR